MMLMLLLWMMARFPGSRGSRRSFLLLISLSSLSYASRVLRRYSRAPLVSLGLLVVASAPLSTTFTKPPGFVQGSTSDSLSTSMLSLALPLVLLLPPFPSSLSTSMASTVPVGSITSGFEAFLGGSLSFLLPAAFINGSRRAKISLTSGCGS
ncbi:hypothetical protein EV127DRAFT_441612 [Xylaria flabelliformis]|nr:hypothetical protein EV127DRAFT_441612 [Xylaria flabelliformis]